MSKTSIPFHYTEEFKILAYRGLYNKLIASSSYEWTISKKINGFIDEYKLLADKHNKSSIVLAEKSHFSLGQEVYKYLNTTFANYKIGEGFKASYNNNQYSSKVKEYLRTISHSSYAQYFMQIYNNINRSSHSVYIYEILFRASYLVELITCLSDKGLHPSALKRDINKCGRYNLLIRYKPLNKKSYKSTYQLLLNESELKEKYLDNYKRGKSIGIKGEIIDNNYDKKILITRCVLDDNEISMLGFKLPQNHVDFINSKYCTDITDSILEYQLLAKEEYYIEGFWNLINPTIQKASRELFHNQHYADSVRSAFVQLNTEVKLEYKKITSEELDGRKLMQVAFAINDKEPIFSIADTNTQSGKSKQQGYHLIFQGVMAAIRNPNAHENITLSQKEALELISLCNHLMNVFEKRL